MNRRSSLKIGASIIAGIMLAPNVKATGRSLVSKTDDSFWDLIKNRRSVRQFRPDPVPYEDLKKIVDAARMSPTAGNQQPWKFIIVQDKKLIEAIKNECLDAIHAMLKENRNLDGDARQEQMKKAGEQLDSGYFSAPAFIVVLTNGKSQYPTYNQHDGPIAAGYLLLAARALGYGTVYVTDAIPDSATQKALNIPEQYSRVCIVPVGIPVEWPEIEKNPLDGFIVNESF